MISFYDFNLENSVFQLPTLTHLACFTPQVILDSCGFFVFQIKTPLIAPRDIIREFYKEYWRFTRDFFCYLSNVQIIDLLGTLIMGPIVRFKWSVPIGGNKCLVKLGWVLQNWVMLQLIWLFIPNSNFFIILYKHMFITIIVTIIYFKSS